MSFKLLAGSALALALLGFAPATAAPVGPATVGIERSDVGPLVEQAHTRRYKHNHYRTHRYYGGSNYNNWNRGHRPYMPIPLAPAPKPKIEYDQADAGDGGRSDRRPVSY